MKIKGICKAKDLIKAITKAWNEARLKEIGIGEVWTFDETDTELIGRN
jgi:ribosomal protein S5